MSIVTNAGPGVRQLKALAPSSSGSVEGSSSWSLKYAANVADYRFVTTWNLRAPLGRVWDAIYDSTDWPRWWRGVVRVEVLLPGDTSGTGAVRRYTWRSKLPYSLVFDMEVTRVQAPHLLEGRASGELE